MSAWKSLSFFTGIVVFFSGMSPVTAEAKSAAPLKVITAEVHRSLNSPKFACQILWVRIQDQDREEFEFLLGSLSHIDQVGRRENADLAKDIRYTTFKIQSLNWVPGSADFKNDIHALSELESLQIVGCQMFTQTPAKK
jgi:hypothetical protein